MKNWMDSYDMVNATQRGTANSFFFQLQCYLYDFLYLNDS